MNRYENVLDYLKYYILNYNICKGRSQKTLTGKSSRVIIIKIAEMNVIKWNITMILAI